AAKMTQAAIRVAATGGADVHAWYQLASSISDAAEMVMEALKTEEKFLKELQKERNDLEEKFKALEKSRREVEQASGLSAVFPTLEKAGRWVIWHKQCGTTEESRVKYRNSVYSTRKDIDKIAEPLKKLETKMKQAPDLKQGVALGAKVMVLKRQVRLAVAAYDAKIKNLEELAQDLAALGATIDDRTLVEKFKSIPELVKSKNFKELASTSKDCFDAVKEIYDTCKEIKELVGEIVELAK
ncbi:MAG TPA: hypothetical protein VGE52_20985, partial [Pirellulales bacterium]